MIFVQDKAQIPFPVIHRTGIDISVDLLKLDYGDDREEFIKEKYFEGHIPSSCRNFFPIEIKFIGALSECDRIVTIHVSGEYLSLGLDADYVRCPLNPLTAQSIADKLGCILPTPKLVDNIWGQGQIKLKPSPWGPPYDSSMMTSERFVKHSHRIDAQIEELDKDPAGKLIVGHKKDVVIHNVLERKTSSVAIYGWTQLNGEVIQKLYLNPTTGIYEPYTGHANSYKDYSHGIRFVDREVWVDNKKKDIIDVMKDPELYPAFGNEPVTVWRQPLT